MGDDIGTDRTLAVDLENYSSWETTPDKALDLYARTHAARCPVAHSGKLGGYYLVLDYADVKTVTSDWERFSSSPTVILPVAGRPGFPPLEFDPPEHSQWRSLINGAFNAATPSSVEASVREDVNRLIDRFAPNGSCDLVADFAEEIPVLALCHIIGFDESKRAVVRSLAARMKMDVEVPERAYQTFHDLAEFGYAEVLEHAKTPRDDFLTHLSKATIDGKPLDKMQIGQVMNSFLVAGHATTTLTLAALFYEVLTRPDVRSQLLENPELIPNAIEETLRLHPPFFGLYRRATRDLELGGVSIPKDSYLQACWAAANRDPDVYDSPSAFRLDRKFDRRSRHMSFGFGIHSCPGAPTARMQLVIALTELLRRLPDIALTDPEAIAFAFQGSEVAGLSSLPASFARRA